MFQSQSQALDPCTFLFEVLFPPVHGCISTMLHAMLFASEADPTNREIAKELQVCLDRSAAGGEALEYRNHAFQDERSLHSERRFTWIPGW